MSQPMRFAHVSGVLLLLVLTGEQAWAQNQLATIPVVVAQAMSFQPDMFGKPRFFDGRTPTDWPAALVPPGAKVVGGGVVGDSAFFRLQTAVFAFSGLTDPNEVLRVLLTGTGYVRHDPEPAQGGGGFVANAPSKSAAIYCKGSSLAGFWAVDSAQAPLVIAVNLIDGEAGRQNCAPQRERTMPGQFAIKVPTLTPPSGTMSFGGSRSWGGSGGSMESILRTTMPADSILYHYTAQLVAGGWRSEGKPGIGDGIGVQRYSFREDQDDWTAVLIILAVGERREVRLQVTKRE
jgi:hypothetical protein